MGLGLRQAAASMSRLERRAARPMSARNAAKTAPAKEPVPEEALPIEGPPGPWGEGGGSGLGAGPPPPRGEPGEPPWGLGAPPTPTPGATAGRAVDARSLQRSLRSVPGSGRGSESFSTFSGDSGGGEAGGSRTTDAGGTDPRSVGSATAGGGEVGGTGLASSGGTGSSAAGTTGATIGSTGVTTGSTGVTTGSTGVTTGSTASITGSTTGSTGVTTGSTASITGSTTGSTGVTTGSTASITGSTTGWTGVTTGSTASVTVFTTVGTGSPGVGGDGAVGSSSGTTWVASGIEMGSWAEAAAGKTKAATSASASVTARIPHFPSPMRATPANPVAPAALSMRV